MDERGAVLDRLGNVRHGRERLVVDLDELGRVDGERAALGHDNRDAVARIARLVGREGPVHGNVAVAGHGPRAGERARPFLRQVGAGEGGDDSLGGQRLREVDLRDLRVRIGAPHDRHPEHPRQRHVVDPARVAAEQARVLLALDRGADVGGLRLGGRHLPSYAVAAARTALTMF